MLSTRGGFFTGGSCHARGVLMRGRLATKPMSLTHWFLSLGSARYDPSTSREIRARTWIWAISQFLLSCRGRASKVLITRHRWSRCVDFIFKSTCEGRPFGLLLRSPLGIGIEGPSHRDMSRNHHPTHVLASFAGSGSTMYISGQLKRICILCELLSMPNHREMRAP